MTVAAQTPGPAETSRLGARQLSRRFGAVLANDDISFEVRRASVHAFVGANGAGKTTLMRLLQGMDRPDSGQVLCNGKPVALSNPAHAFSLGIGMVHQEFMLVPGLTLLENLILGAEPSRAGVIDWAAALRAARGVEAQAGVSLDELGRLRRQLKAALPDPERRRRGLERLLRAFRHAYFPDLEHRA